MLANVGFGASTVAMNAYLPFLARQSEDVVKLQREADTEVPPDDDNLTSDLSADASAAAPLLSVDSANDGSYISSSDAEYATALSRSTARISSHGIAMGYGAGIALLILTLIPVTLMKGSTLALRLAIGASGIWWALGSIPAALWLPSAAEMSKEQSVYANAQRWDEDTAEELSIGQEIKKAWFRLGGTLRPREVKELSNTFKYLAAWFLLSDGTWYSLLDIIDLLSLASGFTTITSTAILFGKTSLGMPASRLVIVGVLTPSAGIAGALLWPKIQHACGWSNLRVLITLVVLASLIPAYGCLGFIPFFSQGRSRFGGLTTQEELYGLALYFGMTYGAFQSYARALYAEIIPPGEEARWWAYFPIFLEVPNHVSLRYGLFSITDKVTLPAST
jgi:UMF1 family MFS transporter